MVFPTDSRPGPEGNLGHEVIAVLHAVPSLDPRHGGPSRTVVALTEALAGRAGVRVGLLSQGREGEVTLAPAAAGVARRLVVGRSRLALALGLPLRGALGRFTAAERPDLVHSHGVWHPVNHWTTVAARRWGVPLVIQPRGMLEPWALGRKAGKKRLALALFQGADLAAATALVATADMEYDNLRRLGLRQPVAVIPNGVAWPAALTAESAGPARPPGPGLAPDRAFDQEPNGASRPFPTPPGQARDGPPRERLALFLSRVHPKKGLRELVRAWAQVAPAGWRLRIAGPDEGGHWAEVARLVDALGLAAAVDYDGPVEGEAKTALYRAADLFVLPTFSENFGLVVAEALSYGVPVITTRGAPWADLETFGCGWWIDTGVEPLARALRAAMALGDAERRAMGERGRVYVRRYDWDAIAAETLALYRWLLGQGERPGSVQVD